MTPVCAKYADYATRSVDTMIGPLLVEHVAVVRPAERRGNDTYAKLLREHLHVIEVDAR